MSSVVLENLNELKGALENLNEEDLLNDRVKLLGLIEECLEKVEIK